MRGYYAPVRDAASSPPSADVYRHEMPGGQYTNLYQQAQALGLDDRWREVCRMYAEVNRLFGDIIKVTPTSKVVGDMALFMVANNLTPEDVLDGHARAGLSRSRWWSSSRAGWASRRAAFRKVLQKRVLRGRKPLRGRPGASLPPADFAATAPAAREAAPSAGRRPRGCSATCSIRVSFPTSPRHQATYSDTSVLPTPVFFYGMEPGEEIERRHRAGQDADRQVPDRRRPARGRQPAWSSSS